MSLDIGGALDVEALIEEGLGTIDGDVMDTRPHLLWARYELRGDGPESPHWQPERELSGGPDEDGDYGYSFIALVELAEEVPPENPACELEALKAKLRGELRMHPKTHYGGLGQPDVICPLRECLEEIPGL